MFWLVLCITSFLPPWLIYIELIYILFQLLERGFFAWYTVSPSLQGALKYSCLSSSLVLIAVWCRPNFLPKLSGWTYISVNSYDLRNFRHLHLQSHSLAMNATYYLEIIFLVSFLYCTMFCCSCEYFFCFVFIWFFACFVCLVWFAIVLFCCFGFCLTQTIVFKIFMEKRVSGLMYFSTSFLPI